MKSFERKFIHELASYYGFETLSHDQEPNRNVAVYALKDTDHPSPKGTALFWGLLAFVFIVGKHIPAEVVGVILIAMGCITAMKKVRFGSQVNAPDAEREVSSKKI